MKRKHKQAVYLTLAIAVTSVMAFVLLFAPDDESQYVQAGQVAPIGHTELINRSEAEVSRITFWEGNALTYMLPFYDENSTLQWSYSAGGSFLLDLGRTRDKARSAWTLSVPEVLHENTEDLNLSDFELAPPRFIMEVGFYDGTSHSVRIGGLTLDLAHRFLMIDDDPAIYLISAFAAERLMAGVSELIDMRLPRIDFEMATYVSIKQQDRAPIEFSLPENVNLLEGHPPGWSLDMTQPFVGFDIRSWFSDEKFKRFEMFRLLRVSEVDPIALDEFGLAEPRLTLEFRDMFDEVTLLFGSVTSEADLVYVKIKGRPHVFVAEYAYMQILLDLNPLDFLLRFIMLVSILEIYGLSIYSVNENENFEIIINHHPYDERIIHPTINGALVEDSEFRTVYQLLIGLMVDSPVEAFTPVGEPDLTIVYHFKDRESRNFRLFSRDAQFYYISLDGGDVQFVVNRRAVERMLDGLQNLI